jgi:hypothetical protein
MSDKWNRLQSHPKPIPGAARYHAEGVEVVMCDTDGNWSTIETCKTEGRALDRAKWWQEREHRVINNAAKQAAKKAKA